MLKFAKDRHRWLQWLYQARKRYHLIILNYVVTSNHIHLLVYDRDGDLSIQKSIQLVAGRTGQEYNIRKRRKGVFWEDRYHATVIEAGERARVMAAQSQRVFNDIRNGGRMAAHPPPITI